MKTPYYKATDQTGGSARLAEPLGALRAAGRAPAAAVRAHTIGGALQRHARHKTSHADLNLHALSRETPDNLGQHAGTWMSCIERISNSAHACKTDSQKYYPLQKELVFERFCESLKTEGGNRTVNKNL
jgi:hypothetical protein